MCVCVCVCQAPKFTVEEGKEKHLKHAPAFKDLESESLVVGTVGIVCVCVCVCQAPKFTVEEGKEKTPKHTHLSRLRWRTDPCAPGAFSSESSICVRDPACL